MAIDVAIEPYQDYMHIRVTGVFALDEAVSHFRFVLKAATQHKLNRILIDYRGLQNIPPMETEAYAYAALIATETLLQTNWTGQRFRIAYLAPEGQTRGEWGEKIAAGHGFFEVKVATDLTEALAWLGVKK